MPGAGGVINGGLTDFSYSSTWGPLDHDQRNTLNVGGDLTLPWRAYASTNVYYGSGFTNAFPGQPYPGDYLPQHTTFDLTLGKDFGERFSASVNAMNVANRRVELDNSVTFGGFHWNNPREDLRRAPLPLPLLKRAWRGKRTMWGQPPFDFSRGRLSAVRPARPRPPPFGPPSVFPRIETGKGI